MNIARFRSLLMVAFVVACGSSARKPAGSADDDTAEPSTASERSGESSSSEGGGEPAASMPKCDDGSCMACGDAICPSGYYCDEGAKPAVCAWIPACATDATCACLGRALPNCECKSRGGGAYVTCD